MNTTKDCYNEVYDDVISSDEELSYEKNNDVDKDELESDSISEADESLDTLDSVEEEETDEQLLESFKNNSKIICIGNGVYRLAICVMFFAILFYWFNKV